jgi:hypothetical protein
MGKVKFAVAGVLFAGMQVSSCTCHRQVDSPELREPPSGFQRSEKRPEKRPGVAQAPTATPPAQAQEEVAQADATPTAAVQIPKDFPADVPIFKDAAVTQVQDLANDAHNVIFQTAAPVEDVASFYQDSMAKEGWKVTQQFARSNHAFMTFQKGNMQANVTVAEDVRNPGQQVIAIMYEEIKPLDFDEF